MHVTGRYSDFSRLSDEDGREAVFHFCPDCGATVFYTSPSDPELIAVPVGAFADPSFPPPTRSIYEVRRHSWVGLAATLERHD